MKTKLPWVSQSSSACTKSVLPWWTQKKLRWNYGTLSHSTHPQNDWQATYPIGSPGFVYIQALCFHFTLQTPWWQWDVIHIMAVDNSRDKPTCLPPEQGNALQHAQKCQTLAAFHMWHTSPQQSMLNAVISSKSPQETKAECELEFHNLPPGHGDSYFPLCLCRLPPAAPVDCTLWSCSEVYRVP